MLDRAILLGPPRGLRRVAGARAIDQDPLLPVRGTRRREPSIDAVVGVTSTLQNTPPISSASASPLSAWRSKIATFTPLAASARAVAAPNPDAPPVTTAALFARSMHLSYQSPGIRAPVAEQ